MVRPSGDHRRGDVHDAAAGTTKLFNDYHYPDGLPDFD